MANDSKWVSDQELIRIREIIETIHYGSVSIIVQDSKIVRIDKN